MNKDKKSIKRDILEKFRTVNQTQDYTLPPLWLEYQYIDRLDKHEKKLCKQAINDLVKRGIVEQVKHPMPNLRLTEKGIALIN